MKRNKRKANEAGAAANDTDDVSYPLVLITEVLQPTKTLKELAKRTKFATMPFYDNNGCRQMIMEYINKNALDKESEEDNAPVLKGGLIRLDPHIYAILNPKPPAMTESVRKDVIFKSIPSCTSPAFVV